MGGNRIKKFFLFALALFLLFGCTEQKQFLLVDSDLNINDLNDVQILSPLNSQILIYNSATGLWVNSNQAGGGGSTVYAGLLPVSVDNDNNVIALNVQANSDWNGTFDGNDSTFYIDFSNQVNRLFSLLNLDDNSSFDFRYVNAVGDTMTGTLQAVNLVSTGDVNGQTFCLDGNCITSWSDVNSGSAGGGSVTDTTLDTNASADLNWHTTQQIFTFSGPTTTPGGATITIIPTTEIGTPDYLISGIVDSTTVFSIDNVGSTVIEDLFLNAGSDQITFDITGVEQVLQSNNDSSSDTITLPPATTTLAGISISQNFSEDQNFFKVNTLDLNVSSGKIFFNSLAYNLIDLNRSAVSVGCTALQYLGGDGACHSVSATGGVTGIFAGKGIDVNSSTGDVNVSIDFNYSSGFFVGLTSNNVPPDLNYGGFSGYAAGNYLCDNNFSGSHMCTTDEIVSSIRTQDLSSWTGTGWIIEGPPGYTVNANDCVGFTDTTATYLGAYWSFNNQRGGEGYLTSCSGTRQLTCCK